MDFLKKHFFKFYFFFPFINYKNKKKFEINKCIKIEFYIFIKMFNSKNIIKINLNAIKTIISNI